MPDISQDDVSEDEPDVSSLVLQNAMHHPQYAQEWDSFLERALARSRNHDIPLSKQEQLPISDDHLWEIGCAVSGPLDVNSATLTLYADRIRGTGGF